MNRRALRIWLAGPAMVVLLAASACSTPPGKPSAGSEVIPPGEVVAFKLLYGQNCAGCHGADGRGGPAIGLANPVFLAIADDTVLRRTITHGVPGTPMSAFASSEGGMLTERQVDALVQGIRSWAVPDALGGAAPPPYAAQSPGNSQRGEDVYREYCSSCHGPNGRGGSKASSIVDGSYLALISDQELRIIVIAGRPELGAPDWRDNIPGHPMSSQDVADVVSWLAGKRPAFPGQPFPSTAMSPADGEAQ